MVNWLIHKLGGVSYREHKELYDKYQKALYETADERAIQLCNETTKQNLTVLENFVRDQYPADWRDDLFNILYNNRMHLIVSYLGNPNRHIVFKVNPTLTSKERLIKNIQNN